MLKLKNNMVWQAKKPLHYRIKKESVRVSTCVVVSLLSTLLYSSNISYSNFVLAEEVRSVENTIKKPNPSNNPEIIKKEAEMASKLYKGKAEEQADNLFVLGKFCYEQADYERAYYYLIESLAKEVHLNRAEELDNTYISLALTATMLRKRQEALKYYKEALDLAEKNKLKENIQLITDSMGTILLLSNNFDEAMTLYQKAFDMAKADGNIATQITSLVNQAIIWRKRQEKEKALKLLHQALDLSKDAEPDRNLANALINLARVEHDSGNLQDSVNSYKKAIEVFREDLDNISEAGVCIDLAETYYDLQQVNNANDLYKQAIAALKDEQDENNSKSQELKMKAMIGLGCAEADLGNFESAEKIHRDCVEIAQKSKNNNLELESIMQLGNDYLIRGFPETSLFRLLEGEKLTQLSSITAKNKGTYLIAIGKAYKDLGQFELAQKYFDEALKLFNDISDKPMEALVLNCLAVLSLERKDKALFETYYQKAKEIYGILDNKRDSAFLDYNLAQYYLTIGKKEEANAQYKSALLSLKDTGDKISESTVMKGMALSELSLGRPQNALQLFQESAKLAEQSGAIEALWDSNLGLGMCYKKLGLTDMAMSHLVKAVDLVEKEKSYYSRDSFKTYKLDMRSFCYTELIDLYVMLSKPYQALEIAEKGRARAFLDMLASRNKSRQMDIFAGPLSDRGESNNIEPNLNKPSFKIAKAEAGSRAVSVIPKASQLYATSAVSDQNAASPDISEIKTLVQNSKSTVLEYFQLPDKLIAWIVKPDNSINMVSSINITKAKLDEKVALTYQAITSQPKTPDEVKALASRRQDLLKELYNDLLKPVEPFLPASSDEVLTIVPHGSMFMVPFAALIAPDNKFLVEKHTLAYVPAIGVMRATQKLEQTVEKDKDKLLAFGNPITKAIEFVGALPYSEKEVQNIAAIFGAANSTIKIGQNADKKTFFELAPQYSDIHLATHGLVDEEHPMDSSLILAPTNYDDGLLTVKDILAMKELKAKLVVLSACQTGRGKITGDGVVGLSRAFIIAGTPSVIVSQWNVDDIITEFQMKEFYKEYLAQKGKSKSLRDAQIAVIKFMEADAYGKSKDGIRANPRYWAAFQVVGQSN